jgi:predicted dithiol-disulfide oxidoreductase (DUF899 family)
MIENHKVLPKAEWIEARKKLLAREKEFTRLRDQLSEERRNLPWERVEKNYVFDGPDGKESLSDLFDGRQQLIVHHFMFDPSWEAGCKSCSFWADSYDGIVVHLRQRDTNLVAISRAPLAKLRDFRRRMGWHFKWLSSAANDFNYDYNVSFTPEELAKGEAFTNYALRKPFGPETVGFSVFHKDPDGVLYHTYSCYSRGVEMVNGAYHFLDLLPKGRGESRTGNPQTWVRYHDSYGR